MNRHKSFGIVFISTTIAVLLIGAVLMMTIDPLAQYHLPLFGMQMDYDNQRYQNPGLERNGKYENIIIGNSMTDNFDEAWFDPVYGTTLKMGFEGGRPCEYAMNLRLIKESGNRVKNVFLTMDNIFLYDKNESKYQLPEYLYDDNYLNDVEYWFNYDIAQDYLLNMVKNNIRRNISDRNSKYMWGSEFLGKDKVLDKFTKQERTQKPVDPTPYIERAHENLSDIIPYIESMPDTKFVLWVAPYSMAYWYDQWNSGRIRAWGQVYKSIFEELRQYPNVDVFLFSDEQYREVIAHLDNYRDTLHFSAEVTKRIFDSFVNGDNRLTGENYAAKIDSFTAYLEGYPYTEKLFRD